MYKDGATPGENYTTLVSYSFESTAKGVHPLEATVSLDVFPSQALCVGLPRLTRIDPLLRHADLLCHDALPVLLEQRVLQVCRGGLSVWEYHGTHLHHVLDLPQAGIHLGDVLHDGDAATLEEKTDLLTYLHKRTIDSRTQNLSHLSTLTNKRSRYSYTRHRGHVKN